MTKKILITPHLNEENGIKRNMVTSYLPDLIIQNGLLPIMSLLPHEQGSVDLKSLAEDYLSDTNALILTGGVDFGSQSIRDLFERYLVELAIEKELPILGLCRGMQILNLVMGGTLKTANNSHFKNTNGESIMENKLEGMNLGKIHEVKLVSSGVLHNWLETDKLWVNSIHSQAVDHISPQLNIEAVDPDGLVEAFSLDHGSILGVQWHPELDLVDKYQSKILGNWLQLV